MTLAEKPDLISAPVELGSHAFGLFPAGVIALCAEVNGAPEGMAASSFVHVSLDPPLVAVCFAHTSNTWPKLRHARRLGISVLSEEHADLARQLASRSRDRFMDVPWISTPDESIFIEGSPLWLECEIVQEVEAGDHDIVVLRVHSVEQHPEVPPVIYYRRRLGGFGHHELNRRAHLAVS